VLKGVTKVELCAARRFGEVMGCGAGMLFEVVEGKIEVNLYGRVWGKHANPHTDTFSFNIHCFAYMVGRGILV
jgi:hypothetical protein